MISYRSSESVKSCFERRVESVNAVAGEMPAADFAARHGMRRHGQVLVGRFDANACRVLIDAMDMHDLGRGRGDFEAVLTENRIPVLVASIRSDGLYWPSEQRELAERIPAAEFIEIDSIHGHDGFLIDADRIEPAVRAFAGRRRRSDVRRAADDCLCVA